MQRTRLADRPLPRYSSAEETMNMVTHIVGGALGILGGLACIVRAALRGSALGVVASAIYTVSLVTLYTMSSVYHGLRPGMGKRVMQVIDHCTIYLLIAGSYTPAALCGIGRLYPALGWSLFGFEWAMAAIAITLTAIDLKKYNVFSMICYIGMGWAIIAFAPQAYAALSAEGFAWIFAGGVAYTLGAVLYGIGSKRAWFHSVFHIFVVLGSVLQLVGIFFFAL
ncbi:MAG: hemolysin III family protein [Firmicutes bacterium]|nr:hemolysin III family protein [Bacillota bacterium]